tara:strand:+ start:1394 stop:1639 length:246 start_codon:yes stop_codon:yes gene_type:complete
MTLEPEDHINNAKAELSRALSLLLDRANLYKGKDQLGRYAQTVKHIATIRIAIKAIKTDQTNLVLPPIPKRIPHECWREIG